jgi:hypothetical protein
MPSATTSRTYGKARPHSRAGDARSRPSSIRSPKGMTRVILFSKDILKIELKADAPRHDAVADKRARAWAKREARMKRVVDQHRSSDRRG